MAGFSKINGFFPDSNNDLYIYGTSSSYYCLISKLSSKCILGLEKETFPLYSSFNYLESDKQQVQYLQECKDGKKRIKLNDKANQKEEEKGCGC